MQKRKNNKNIRKWKIDEKLSQILREPSPKPAVEKAEDVPELHHKPPSKAQVLQESVQLTTDGLDEFS